MNDSFPIAVVGICPCTGEKLNRELGIGQRISQRISNQKAKLEEMRKKIFLFFSRLELVAGTLQRLPFGAAAQLNSQLIETNVTKVK